MNGWAASRISNTPASTRQGATTQKVRTKTATTNKSVRIATPQKQTVSRTAKTPTTKNTTQRSATQKTSVKSRANVVARNTTETRTGAEYESCKNAFFACMDQFCQLKNDDYRRCSCSNRISALQTAKDNLTQANEQLNTFNENLEIVGKTAAQAIAMNTASDGEQALTKDKTASTALLNAILNTIRGSDSRVEHSKLSDLNSIDLSFDAANSFGTTDAGQIIASYNGQELYSAVYPQCRSAVKSNCNDASLQRAVNAYLMAIEQDCNTVQTAITNKQKETHAAIRESSSMLDLARADNHKKHNSDDIATCLANVESAILSEEVCGKNYHKCLDNGKYIDVSTGAPITGVVDFYKLGTLLKFTPGRNNETQKLAQNPDNQEFVYSFEKHVKQFAEPALDKCYDNAQVVWQDYLNKAMLDIYYAQQSKVNEIKQGCFDFVSACYMNSNTAITAAMQGLLATQTNVLKPGAINLTKELCSNYIESCNNMFDNNIISEYVQNRNDVDSLSACRAIAKQCFDGYGGQNYENFYHPYSGLFEPGKAIDWFTLYECDNQECSNPKLKSECAKQLYNTEGCREHIVEAFGGLNYYSTSRQYGILTKDGISPRLLQSKGVATEIYNQIIDTLQTQCANLDGKFLNIRTVTGAAYQYTYNQNDFCQLTVNDHSRYKKLFTTYSIGKKENYSVWNPLLNCDYGNHHGNAFSAVRQKNAIKIRRIKSRAGGIEVVGDNFADPYVGGSVVSERVQIDGDEPYLSSPDFCYGGWETKARETLENICPRDYENDIDIKSWGICSCWENGGRRSNDGTTIRCMASFPVTPLKTYNINTYVAPYSAEQVTTSGLNHACSTASFITEINQDPSLAALLPSEGQVLMNAETATSTFSLWPFETTKKPTDQDWCTAEVNDKNQVCPFGVKLTNSKECAQCPFDGPVQTQGNTSKCCPPTHNNESTSTTLYYYRLSNNDVTLCCPTTDSTIVTLENVGKFCCPSSGGTAHTKIFQDSTTNTYGCCPESTTTFTNEKCDGQTDPTTPSTPVESINTSDVIMTNDPNAGTYFPGATDVTQTSAGE